MGLWLFQINWISAYGVNVPHFIGSASCRCGIYTDLVSVTVLPWSQFLKDLVLSQSWS